MFGITQHRLSAFLLSLFSIAMLLVLYPKHARAEATTILPYLLIDNLQDPSFMGIPINHPPELSPCSDEMTTKIIYNLPDPSSDPWPDLDEHCTLSLNKNNPTLHEGMLIALKEHQSMLPAPPRLLLYHPQTPTEGTSLTLMFNPLPPDLLKDYLDQQIGRPPTALTSKKNYYDWQIQRIHIHIVSNTTKENAIVNNIRPLHHQLVESVTLKPDNNIIVIRFMPVYRDSEGYLRSSLPRLQPK